MTSQSRAVYSKHHKTEVVFGGVRCHPNVNQGGAGVSPRQRVVAPGCAIASHAKRANPFFDLARGNSLNDISGLCDRLLALIRTKKNIKVPGPGPGYERI